MDTLSAYHSVDIQWGNHDIVWMGAASGQTACMATVLRISARYGNLDTLEEGYGINLIPLATFALKTYENSDCSVFSIKYGADYDVKDLKLDMMMHKAIAIIQFKLEGQRSWHIRNITWMIGCCWIRSTLKRNCPHWG